MLLHALLFGHHLAPSVSSRGMRRPAKQRPRKAIGVVMGLVMAGGTAMPGVLFEVFGSFAFMAMALWRSLAAFALW